MRRTSYRVPPIHITLSGLLAIALTLACTIDRAPADAGAAGDEPAWLASHYDKREYRIPMRDGVHLFTAVYVPTDTSRAYPFLMRRTPYGVHPYGEDEYPETLGPIGSRRFAEEGFIFVYQDVRGRFMSEGEFGNMRPHLPEKAEPEDIDESTDTYDTVEWLLENVDHNNGRVGLWGISYPGFYAAAGIIDGHPAIKASSPQAPIGDWFIGDDFHHKGAFFLQDAFGFFYVFGQPRPGPTAVWPDAFDFGMQDAYRFFLEMGPLPNANDRYFHHRVAFWDSMMAHGTYDEFWQRRNIIPHMEGIHAAVMTVAGWFDAEDPYGPIEIYRSIEERNPGVTNTLVVGPWFHGGWVRSEGERLGNVSFGSATSRFYQDSVDLPFFKYHLKDEGEWQPPEALAFATGSNRWHRLDAWPPANLEPTTLYFGPHGSLTFEAPAEDTGADRYESDPGAPVPYTQEVTIERTREYMVEDQRFAGRRPDVLVYQSDLLPEDLTFAGPLSADLYVSTSASDLDLVVKLIDVYPDDARDPEEKYLPVPMAGYQMLVRGEVMRGKFRESYERPEPFEPGRVTRVRFETPHVFHTFRAGHRVMVQVQSSWFPLVDRNPQTLADIYDARPEDFRSATVELHRSRRYPSSVSAGRFRG